MSIPDTDKGQHYRSVWRHLMNTAFRQDFVDVGGIRTRFVEAGPAHAPVLLMLHGTSGHWEAFCANLGPLSQNHRCIAIDMVGCGFSDKPDTPFEIPVYARHVLAFMDTLGIARAALMGVSLGAWVSCRVALMAPQRVSHLVLVSPPGLLPMPPSVASGASAERRAAANDPSWDSIAKTLTHLYHDQRNLIDDIVAVRQQVYRQPGFERAIPNLLALFDPVIRARNNLSEDEWRRLDMPALVIEHVDSPDMYLQTARAIVKLMPAARLAAVPRSAHWAQFEQPELFNRLVSEFLG